MAGEDLSVVLAKRCGIHVVENTNVVEDLPDPVGRPSMDWEELNAVANMIEPICWACVRFKVPQMNLEDS
jgi:hypothetical protein